MLSGEVRLTTGGLTTPLTERSAVWKLLAELLGLYSVDDPLTSTHTDRWLLEASAHLAGQLPLDELNRRLGAFLGRFDYLTTANAVLLPDVVLRALFADGAQMANNVELWTRRVDAALANLKC